MNNTQDKDTEFCIIDKLSIKNFAKEEKMKRRIYPPWENWSASKLELIFTCPLSFFFSYVIRSTAEPNIRGIFGIAIHRMVRKFFTLKNGYRSEKSFIGTWKHYWWKEILGKEYKDLIKESDCAEFGKFFAIGVNILKAFYKENLPYRNQKLRPLVERKFNCIFKGHRLSGRMDRVQPRTDGKREIWDYKTGLHKAAEPELIRDIQFTFYNLLYFMKYGENPESMWLYYLSDGKKVQVPIRTSAEYLRLSLLLDEAKMYVKNILQPSSNYSRDLPFSWLNPEDIERRRFSDRPGPFCNICDHEAACREFQPNDLMRELWVNSEVERARFRDGSEQLMLPFENGGKNETITACIS